MLRILLAVLLLISSPAWAVTQWNKAIPAAGDAKSAWPAAVTSQWSILDTLVSNYRKGYALIYSSSSALTVSAGEVVVSNSGGSTRLFLQNASNTSATTSNLDTGSSFSSSTTYYVYAGTSSATAADATIYISLSSSAPTGVTYYKLLGNFITDGSGNIQNGVIFDEPYGNQKADANGRPLIWPISYNYSTSASSYTSIYPGQMKTAYGEQTLAGNGNQAISNLPFASTTSYKCVTGYVGSDTNIGSDTLYTRDSASGITLYNGSDATATISWICVGN